MKSFIYLSIALCIGLASSQGEARPGGGGGHMGGKFKPSKPSMGAKPQPHPGVGAKPGQLPAKPGGVKPTLPGHAGGGPGAIKPKPGTLPGKPGGKPGAGDVGKFLGSHPPGHFPGTPGHVHGYGGYHKAEFHGHIHDHFPYHPTYGHPFSQAWCGHFHWHYSRWPYWTAAATGAAMAQWIGSSYTGYGSSQQIVYYPVESAPQEVYEQSVAAPAAAVQAGQAATVSDDVEWMNIGTFGIIPYQASDFAYGIQLATTKDGIVRGIQWDMKNNTSIEIEGSIQKDTLRIAWKAKSADALMYETNVDNLTQQESMVNVYNPKTKGLVSWQLIQIDQKDLPTATK